MIKLSSVNAVGPQVQRFGTDALVHASVLVDFATLLYLLSSCKTGNACLLIEKRMHDLKVC